MQAQKIGRLAVLRDVLRANDSQNRGPKGANEARHTTIEIVVAGVTVAILTALAVTAAVSPTGRGHTAPRIKVPAAITQSVGGSSVNKLITSDNPLRVYLGATILDRSGQLNSAAVAFERSGALYFNFGKYRMATTSFETAASIFHQARSTNAYAVALKDLNQSIVLSLS